MNTEEEGAPTLERDVSVLKAFLKELRSRGQQGSTKSCRPDPKHFTVNWV